MKFKIITIALLLAITQMGLSQATKQLDAAFSKIGAQNTLALGYSKLFGIGKNKKFKVGYGVRYSFFSCEESYFTTAPAILTSKQKGPQVLFSPIYYENVDSLKLKSARQNMLNASIHLEYALSKKWEVGFNIDVVGFSFGPKVSGKYYGYQSEKNFSEQAAKPTTLNALLVSDNDIGGLNSELYVKRNWGSKIGLKAGATFIFSEFTSDNKLRLDNDRWRNKALLPMVGIFYKLN